MYGPFTSAERRMVVRAGCAAMGQGPGLRGPARELLAAIACVTPGSGLSPRGWAGGGKAAYTRWVVAGVLLIAAAAPARGDLPPLNERYRDPAGRILEATLAGNDGYNKLETLCLEIGHRLSGSESLERAVEWAVQTLRRDGHENVRAEPVQVPKWVRGRESAELVEPRRVPLAMLGLGGSVGTPPGGITAPVLVVRDEQELNERSAEAAGRIVLFNFPMPPGEPPSGGDYRAAVRYRTNAARWAAGHGAVAALIRSVTTRSLYTPHTGAMSYGDAQRRIPSAALSVEDAELLARLARRGLVPVVRLEMEARTESEQSPSANVVAELVGWEKPYEVVVIGGHLDSWDVGQGAQDDGAGCVFAMEALNVLRRLGLRPRRTIRVVLFTNEENGLAGGRAYAERYAEELGRHVAAIEADSGAGAPLGYGLELEDEARRAVGLRQLREIVSLLGPLGDLTAREGGGGADIGPMRPAGVPLIGHRNDVTHYFDIHHTQADTIDKVDPEILSHNVAALAVTAYVLADMEERFAE